MHHYQQGRLKQLNNNKHLTDCPTITKLLYMAWQHIKDQLIQRTTNTQRITEAALAQTVRQTLGYTTNKQHQQGGSRKRKREPTKMPETPQQKEKQQKLTQIGFTKITKHRMDSSKHPKPKTIQTPATSTRTNEGHSNISCEQLDTNIIQQYHDAKDSTR